MMFKESGGGVTFSVQVAPRSSQNQIVGVASNLIKIRLTAAPVDGKANLELIKFLAQVLGVSRAQVEILRGDRSKQKIVRVRGVSIGDVQQKLVR